MSSTDPPIIAFGASAGGLTEIITLLGSLPVHPRAILMGVLHRPSNRISSLQQIMARASAIPVLVARDGDAMEVGCCYIGEPASHLVLLAGGRSGLQRGGLTEFRNRTVDLLFASVARHAGNRAMGVVLSGELADGSRGLAAIKAAGGMTFVQSPSDAANHGMPENAIHYDGVIDVVAPTWQLAAQIGRRLGG